MPADVPELVQEREFLAEARSQLGRMRERVAALDGRYAGDPISADALEATLARRMKTSPTTPRSRSSSAASTSRRAPRSSIGRRHVSDADGEPMVVDWRAPVSTPFYRATPRSRWASRPDGATASPAAA